MNATSQFGLKQNRSDRLKGLIGETLAQIFPARLSDLSKTPYRKQAHLIDRLLVQGLIRSSTRNGDLNTLSRIHRCEWNSGQLDDFYAGTRRRFQDWFLKRHIRVIDELERKWNNLPDEFHTVVEIGCGAGQVLQYFADRFPQAQRFVGLDVCADQVGKNRQNNQSDKIEYHAGNALEWILQNAEPGTVFISNGGVLEYFSPTELDQLFDHIQSNVQPAMVVTIEPVAHDHDMESLQDSQPFGSERSLSHNYAHRLRNAGLEITFHEEEPTDEYRFMLLLSETESKT